MVVVFLEVGVRGRVRVRVRVSGVEGGVCGFGDLGDGGVELV